MNPNREELLFGLALTKPAAERAAWLDRECGDDKALCQRLDTLLAAHEMPATVFATSVEASQPTVHDPAQSNWPAHPVDEIEGSVIGR